jgi:drug/metabolite transporter (DMT)-like permease
MTRLTRSTQGLVLCSLAMVLVGSTVVASRIIGTGLPPFTATALRHAVALPLFLLVLRLSGERASRPDRHDTLLLIVQAAAGSVGYTVLLLMGTARIGAADAGIIAGTLPAVSGLFAVLALGERASARRLGALALACAGVLAVSWPSDARSNGPSSGLSLGTGHLLVLGAVVCEAAFILLNRRLRVAPSALRLSTWMSAGGLLLSLGPAAIEWRTGLPAASGAALAGVIYYALVPTLLGFLLWYAGSARTDATGAALSTAWLPVSALLLSAGVLGEPIGLRQGLGLLCVLAAIGLGSLGDRRTRA